MKKSARLFAVVLVCALLLSLVTVAHADSCYEMLKFLYQYEGEGMVVTLGEGFSFPAELEDKNVLFVVDIPSASVSMVGLNAQSEPEGHAWTDVDETNAMLAFVQFCVSYEQLCDELDECEKLIGGIYMAEGEDPYLIDSAESAQVFVDVFTSLMSEE